MDWSIDCPHCGYKHEDWQNFIDTDEMEGEFPMDCEDCGMNFKVTYWTKITFETKKNT